jgi:hypothetical protein
MPAQLVIPLAAAGPLAGAIAAGGLLATAAYLIYRFGPALARLTGWCAWWVAWACGSQGGYGYCVALLLLGTLAWGGGTIWYERRRGRWPSPLSAKLFTRLLPRHAAARQAQRTGPGDAHVLRRHR